MERGADGRLLVAADSSLVLNFLKIDRVDILATLPGFHFHVLNHVVAEVTQEPTRSRLAAAIAAGQLTTFEMTDLAAIATYDALRLVLGDGEAATIAAAQHQKWIVGMDEKGRARREVVSRLGEDYLLNTPGVLVQAVLEGSMAVDQAEDVRDQLAQNQFTISVAIADLMEERERGRDL